MSEVRVDTHHGDGLAAALPLSEREYQTYRAVVEGSPVDGAAARSLEELGLIEPTPAGYVALDPRAVVRRMLADEREAVRQAADRMARISELETLSSHWDLGQISGGPTSEYYPSSQTMGARLSEVLEGATETFLSVQTLHPHSRNPAIQRLSARRTKQLLERGIAVRAVYTADALDHPQTRAFVTEVQEAGADIRAGTVLPPRMVIVDRRRLFIENAVGTETSSGWCVTDVAAVAWAGAVFEAVWARCTPWTQAIENVRDAVTTSRQRAILRRMSEGHLQEAVGAALGLSTRTVTGELSALRERLGLISTYQLMVWWATSEDRGLP
ncbi:LuxR C-terminal-related transcriptional regulator [Streptomyces griseoluteus]|uniref:LuxR C-terminal-related transcriptional regulator n=1 Tax=Streptomyces griseoluteus TaxID=29306 RepID=UPI003655B240